MLPLDFEPNLPKFHPSLQFWDIKTRNKYFAQIPTVKLEEEEEEEEEEGFDFSTFDGNSNTELSEQWYEFYLRYKYPLYCMILATEADENVARLIEKHRQELTEMAGDKCCLVYFRDIEKAKQLEPFQFAEHAKKIMQFIRIIKVQPNKLPSLLFFERISSGEFVYVEVENRTVPEIMGLLRELFTFIYMQKEVSLSAVRKFKFSKKVQLTRKTLTKNLMQFSKEMVGELIKSLAKFP